MTMTLPETVTFETSIAGSGGKTGIINEAKSPETRRRRIEKALALFRQGKKR